MNVNIEVFYQNKWHEAASFTLLGEAAWEQGYRAPGVLAYDTHFAINHINQTGLTAVSSCYPVDFALIKTPARPLDSDKAVLRNEAAYYRVAKMAGLRVYALPEYSNNTLFVPRFDRKTEHQKVIRYGQESLCSLAGVADFGQAIPMEILCDAFMPHVTHPKQELKEFLLPDMMFKANVDDDLIKRLDSRIKDVTRSLKQAKPNG